MREFNPHTPLHLFSFFCSQERSPKPGLLFYFVQTLTEHANTAKVAYMAKTFTAEEVLNVIGEKIKGSSLRKVAKEISVSPAYLSDIMKKRRDISDFIAAQFGFERTVTRVVVFKFKRVGG